MSLAPVTMSEMHTARESAKAEFLDTLKKSSHSKLVATLRQGMLLAAKLWPDEGGLEKFSLSIDTSFENKDVRDLISSSPKLYSTWCRDTVNAHSEASEFLAIFNSCDNNEICVSFNSLMFPKKPFAMRLRFYEGAWQLEK